MDAEHVENGIIRERDKKKKKKKDNLIESKNSKIKWCQRTAEIRWTALRVARPNRK